MLVGALCAGAVAGPAAAQPLVPKISAKIGQAAWERALAAPAEQAAREQLSAAWRRVPAAGRVTTPAQVFSQPGPHALQAKKTAPAWLKHFKNLTTPFQPARVGKQIYSSKKELKRAVEQSYSRVLRFQEKNFKRPEDIPFRTILYKPFNQQDAAALSRNKTALRLNQRLLARLEGLERWPDKGRGELGALYSSEAISFLVSRLQKEKFIMLGERHESPAVQQMVGRLLVQLKRALPKRRIVLFSEFIDLPPIEKPDENALYGYYRRVQGGNIAPFRMQQMTEDQYAGELFFQLLQENIEIYPLEDPVQNQIFEEELDSQMELSFFTVSARNKTWARVIESKMAEIRREDPETLFVVYAGIGHTSWLAPVTIPKLFANEHTVVVELSARSLSRFNALYPVWGKDDSVFRRRSFITLLHWRGQYARTLAKQTGFDYAVIVPEK